MFESNTVGSIWFACHVEWWRIAVIVVVLSTGMIWCIRYTTEGRWYDVALSSVPGDAFLALYCGIVAYMHRNNSLPGIHTIPMFHALCAWAGCIAGIMIQREGLLKGGIQRQWNEFPVQWYHNLFVVPVLAYAVTSTLPILFYQTNSQPQLTCAAFMCLCIWFFLFLWDVGHNLTDEALFRAVYL